MPHTVKNTNLKERDKGMMREEDEGLAQKDYVVNGLKQVLVHTLKTQYNYWSYLGELLVKRPQMTLCAL